MKIIVGSTALQHYTGGFKRKHKSDIDTWTDVDETFSYQDVSLVPVDILESFEERSKYFSIATPSDVMTIKLSHLPYDIKWWKHVQDYLVLKTKYGCTINQVLYEKLKVYWKEVHNNKPYLSLYKTKDEFFDDYVEKVYDHDWLHQQVAYPDFPVYTKCLKEGQEVAIDHDKFLGLAFEDQVKMFREEINVIALERWVLNPKTKGKISFREAYSRSVHKTVTALTKGWASEFICKNLECFIRPNYKEVEYCLKGTMI